MRTARLCVIAALIMNWGCGRNSRMGSSSDISVGPDSARDAPSVDVGADDLLWDGGECPEPGKVGDELCAATCEDYGRCHACGDKQCVAWTDSECAASGICLSSGDCSVVNGACHASSDADCSKSWFCEWQARCTAQSGECVIGALGCAIWHGCTNTGRCTFSNNQTCVADSDADCQGSAACKGSEAYCQAINGKCCSNSGQCI